LHHVDAIDVRVECSNLQITQRLAGLTSEVGNYNTCDVREKEFSVAYDVCIEASSVAFAVAVVHL
jgi:hypothetical protein